MAWDPARYETYRHERARPFEDLLARVPSDDPGSVIDAGCGTGRTTARLAARFPHADVLGIDASPEMLARAPPHDRVRYAQADLTTWRPEDPVGLVVAHAVLHWVPHPDNTLRRLAAWARDGGTLAIQVPANHDAPSHRIVRTVAATAPWRDKMQDLRKGDHVLPLDAYARILSEALGDADAWETTYLHKLSGADPVLHWLEGTTLRPYLDVLDEADRTRFLDDLAGPLADAYPDEDGITWFPFTRRFVVARRV